MPMQNLYFARTGESGKRFRAFRVYVSGPYISCETRWGEVSPNVTLEWQVRFGTLTRESRSQQVDKEQAQSLLDAWRKRCEHDGFGSEIKWKA